MFFFSQFIFLGQTKFFIEISCLMHSDVQPLLCIFCTRFKMIFFIKIFMRFQDHSKRDYFTVAYTEAVFFTSFFLVAQVEGLKNKWLKEKSLPGLLLASKNKFTIWE